MVELVESILSLWSLDWKYNDSSIRILVSLVAIFSSDAVTSDAKPLEQKLFKAFWWNATSGAWRSYSISPVYFVFPIGTGNIGCVIIYWCSILFLNNLLYDLGSLVLKFSSIHSISILNTCFDLSDFAWNKFLFLGFSQYIYPKSWFYDKSSPTAHINFPPMKYF